MICFFPIEITARETVGHIQIAAALADLGVTSILGHKEEVGHLLKRCSGQKIIFYKGDRREAYISRDDIAVGQDPEAGIVFQSFSDFFKIRPVSLGRLSDTSGYFCFGQDDFSYLRDQYPESVTQIHLTGSPRVDSWLPESEDLYSFEMQRIRRKYNEFILLSSSGSRGSPVELQRLNASVTPAEQKKILAQQLLEEEKCRLLLEVAQKIRASTKMSVVIRPHPAESFSRWLKDIVGVHGVYVDAAYDLSAWVRSAHAVVQDNSTAAFEAWHANIPVFAVPQLAHRKQHEDPSVDIPGLVSNQLAINSASMDDLVDAIGDPDALWQENRMDESKSLIIGKKTLTGSGWSAPKIASIIAGLPFDGESTLSHYDYAYSTLQRIRPGLHPISGRERLGRKSPPPFKRWNLGSKSMRHKLEVATNLFGLAESPSIVRVGFNSYLIGPRKPSFLS